MAAKQPDIKIPKPDDLMGLVVKFLNEVKSIKQPLKKTSVNLHGSPSLGLKKIDPMYGMEDIPYLPFDAPAVWTQKIPDTISRSDFLEIQKMAKQFASGSTRTNDYPLGTGSIYGSRIPEYNLYDGGYENWAATINPMKVKKELTLAGKTEQQQLKELEKFLKRQGIKIR
jgi:hypothetical protein